MGKKTFLITDRLYKIKDFDTEPNACKEISVSETVFEKIRSGRKFLEKKIAESNQLFYGINTGFGALCDVEITKDKVEELQENLVKSHACGMGNAVPESIVKLMIQLKLISLGRGFSGISPETYQQLITLYNQQILPVIYEQGSLGASGDLAPLAHMSLPLIGKGRVSFKRKVHETEKLFEKQKIQPVHLKSKEGLALLNGTQFMLAYAVFISLKASKLAELADLAAALSCEAFSVKKEPFHAFIQLSRPYQGQITVAKNIASLLESDGDTDSTQVQDPYSFRCIPQVHGASRDVLQHCINVFETEINSITDNPLVFEEQSMILSGGNFHGQPLALALDYLTLALAEWGNISERRTYQLLSGKRGLPVFLTKDSGLHSGFMIPQYTAASIVSANKQLSSPASIDSIISSNGQEDHVSMGANAAVKCLQVLENLEKIIAIEFLTSVRALHFKKKKVKNKTLSQLKEDFLAEVPVREKDHELYKDMEKAHLFVKRHTN